MTERTFREPSPSRPPERPASSHGPYPKFSEEAPPPVPSLPKRYTSPPPVSQRSGQRPASVEPAAGLNPAATRVSGGRGVSLDRGSGGTPTPRTLKQHGPSLDSVGEAQQAATQATNRVSVNYSRPMSPQNFSPSPSTGGRVRSPTPSATKSVALPTSEVNRIMGSLQDTAERPVKKKKKKKVVAEGSTEGAHLAASFGNEPPQESIASGHELGHSRPASSSVKTKTISKEADLAPPRSQKKKKKTVLRTEPRTEERDEGFGNAYPSDTDSVVSDVSSTTDKPRNFNTRAAGILAKQPSIVREDREGEEKAERKLSGSRTASQSNANTALGSGVPANTSRIVSKERPHTRSASQSEFQQDKGPPPLDVPDSARPVSLSPARAAHFSAQPTYETPEGIKHQPLGRSVSPAKSALKYSPSRGHSPSFQHSARLAPGEASDTASGLSDEGSRSRGKKKKGVRVSFDEDAVMVGQASSPIATGSPVLLSPQSKPKTRTWLDLVRDKKNVHGESDQEQEDTSIKPIPTLPSFGSVRGRKEKAVPGTSNSASSAREIKVKPSMLGTSSDQAIGALIAKDDVSQQGKGPAASVESRPQEPASVEGTHHQTNDDLGPHHSNRVSEPDSLIPTPSLEESKEAMQPRSPLQPQSKESGGLVPSIAVLPATPGVDEIYASQREWPGIPGQSSETAGASRTAIEKEIAIKDASSKFAAHDEGSPAISAQEHPSPVITPATLGIAEPEPEAVAALHEPGSPHVGEVAETMRTQIDSQSGDSTDENSIYSDAAEDQSDFEGDGFGSINAIVESPATPNFAAASKSPPASPTLETQRQVGKQQPPPRHRNDSPEPAPAEGWDRAQAYWSGLSQTQKEQLEHAALPGAVDEPAIPDRTMRGKGSVAKKKKTKKVAAAANGQGGAHNQSALTATNADRPSAMRVAQPNAGVGTQMRGSMRDGRPLKPALKETTQRSAGVAAPPEPRGTLQKRTRPVSAVPVTDHNKLQGPSAVSHARSASATSPTTSSMPVGPQKKKAAAPKPKHGRALSDGSDSDSSFKRMRSSTPDTSTYKMKRTMRGAGSDAGQSAPANRASSLRARNASPANSTARRSFSAAGHGGGGMRMSMRDSIDSTKPTRMSLRGSIDSSTAGRTKSPSRFGLGFGSKSKETKTAPKAASKRSRRFADSSDEEDEFPAMASSRFADSSDEDEPAKFAPVRGIPRRIEEGDSTDLEDSSSEKGKVPASGRSNDTQPTTVSVPSTKPAGQALASGSLRTPSGDTPTTAVMGTGLQAKKAAEKEKKKRSFLGVLGGRRKDDPSRVRSSDLEMAARKDNSLGGTAAERVGNASQSTPKKGNTAAVPASPNVATSAQASPKSPKLQRRVTPKMVATANKDGSWPLGQNAAGSKGPTGSAPVSRPRTSDGANQNNVSAARPDLGDRRTTVQSTATVPGKKKKFPMLRKAFGMHS